MLGLPGFKGDYLSGDAAEVSIISTSFGISTF